MIKKIIAVVIFITLSTLHAFSGGAVAFQGTIVLTDNGEKGILGNDQGIMRFVPVYGNFRVFYGEMLSTYALHIFPVGIKVDFKGGITGGVKTDEGWYRYDLSGECTVIIKTQEYTVPRNATGKSIPSLHEIVQELMSASFSDFDPYLIDEYIDIIQKLNNHNPAVPLKPGQTIVLPVIEKGFKIAKYRLGSEVVFPEIKTIIRIAADSAAYNENNLPCLRQLVTIEYGNGFSVINKILLPVNVSSDFPYEIVLHHNERNLKYVVIKGYYHFHIYNVSNNKLSEKLIPKFASAEHADSQSGSLSKFKLTADGKTLSGYALDFGNFEYDLSNPDYPIQK